MFPLMRISTSEGKGGRTHTDQGGEVIVMSRKTEAGGEERMRTEVPACPDLQDTRNFSLTSAGSVLLLGGTIETNHYCIHRETLWYCNTLTTRYSLTL